MFGLLVPFSDFKLFCGCGGVTVTFGFPNSLKFTRRDGVVVRVRRGVVEVDHGIVYVAVFGEDNGPAVGVVAGGFSKSV